MLSPSLLYCQLHKKSNLAASNQQRYFPVSFIIQCLVPAEMALIEAESIQDNFSIQFSKILLTDYNQYGKLGYVAGA